MGRGGSRWGAGRPAHKGKAEHCLRLDVRTIQRAGLLRSGASGGWAWHREGERTGNVGLQSLGHVLRVDCQINGRDAGHAIPLDCTPCHFGGTRPWFHCPSCHRRAAVLFLRGGAPFRCRHCAKVAYASQSEDAMDRAWRKQSKLERRLTDCEWKPKGMHWRTFERLQVEIGKCEAQREIGLAAAIQRLGLIL
jgi:hypothetical protein